MARVSPRARDRPPKRRGRVHDARKRKVCGQNRKGIDRGETRTTKTIR